MIYRLLLTLYFGLFASSAMADPLSDILDGVFGQEASTPVTPHGMRGRKNYRHAVQPLEPVASEWGADGSVYSQIRSYVSAHLGPQWVATAVNIARIESGGRCGAVNRSGATGVFQVMHPERFGISRASARTCSGGIAAGVAHMKMCLAKGASNSFQMYRCHNAGSPFARRVEPAYRRYL